ncbi:MAG: Holliday junction branch migration protein RuvA [SAR202 cluster bacterium]|jgi:Holliday junction DNA helicase RuvA|nr:MAG: Holliday junction branch migration protein RuvA [SAR202 cluster bacterium]MCH2318771.1 Holliday junction branch migration protein RuvA [SAR202 cluster bacterium]MQF67948.1 Holliday junction branch migration protein RuvA [SAR202 cluster bacterium AD-802-K11_MRT_200m]MQG74928.1 Holliday junction branch migration protein RuvA [SAR202 cluster bacterium]
MVTTLISAVSGKIESKGPEYVDVNVYGVTFRISTPTTTIDQIGESGDSVRLLTSLQLRQDSITMYGFATEEDRIAFDALININGVGPRLAIAVLSTFDAGSMAAAVQSEDTGAFVRVPGVGARTASRIVLELKGKLDQSWSIPGGAEIVDDVFDSLTSLGYSIQETRNAITSINTEENNKLNTEEKLRLALQFLTSQ